MQEENPSGTWATNAIAPLETDRETWKNGPSFDRALLLGCESVMREKEVEVVEMRMPDGDVVV